MKLTERGTRRTAVGSSAQLPGRAGGAASRYDALTGSRGGGLQLDIERLFNQKQRIMASVSFTSASLVEGVVKGTLKTLVECIRMNTFGKHGFQQMQVVCCFDVCS